MLRGASPSVACINVDRESPVSKPNVFMANDRIHLAPNRVFAAAVVGMTSGAVIGPVLLRFSKDFG